MSGTRDGTNKSGPDLFYAGGECFERFGTIVRHSSLAEDRVTEVHTRAGEAGATGRDGIIRAYAANLPRIEYGADGVGLLLERAGENLQINSTRFDNWTASGPITVTADTDAAPDGSTTADTLDDQSVTDVSSVRRDATVSDSTLPHCVSVYLKKRTSTGAARLRLLWNDGAGGEANLFLDTATGEFLTDGNELAAGVIDAGQYWRPWVAAVGDGTQTVIRQHVYPAARNLPLDGTNSEPDAVGDCIAWGAQVEQGGGPSSFVETVATPVTRAEDLLYAPYPHPPQEMTAYVRWIEGQTLTTNNARWLQIGAATSSRFILYHPSQAGRIEVLHGQTGATRQSSTVVAGGDLVAGDVCEMAAALYADGSVELLDVVARGVSLGGGPRSTALPLLPGWSTEELYINGPLPGPLPGTAQFLAVKAHRGVRSLEFMRGL